MYKSITLKRQRKKKLLLITFDYELFLGEKSGSVQQCLIKPTDKLLNCLDKNAFKAVFFVDTVYLLRLQEMAKVHSRAKVDLISITNQIAWMVNNGHEIHPHIHAHWIDAVYDPKTNQWCLNEKRFYTFSALSERQRVDLFDRSVALIQSLLELGRQTQPIDAYRAGGWSIQPFEDFSLHFKKHGIKHEFSVLPGRYCYSDAHHFDFRSAPVDMQIYRFSQDICKKDERGLFTEWTISSMPRSKIQRWIDFKINGMLQRCRIVGRFEGSTIKLNIKEEGDSYSRDILARHIASFEGLNPYRVRRYLRAIKKTNYFHFISHPKLISRFEVRMVDLLLGLLSKDSGIETDFRKHQRMTEHD